MDIDEDLQSRQLAVYGRESMRRLRNASVLIIGSDGVAAEISKNVILANVRAVTLCDLGEKVTYGHLSSHFFLTEDDIGMCVAEATQRRFQELNNEVNVSAIRDIPESLEPYTVVVCVGLPLAQSLRLNDQCRNDDRGVAFIRCCSRGLYGNAFSDFGNDFCVHDTNGEQAYVSIITHIQDQGESLEIFCVTEDSQYLPFSEGDTVKFSEVKGMTELNDQECKVTSSSRFSVRVKKPAGVALSAYVTGGMAAEVKLPTTLNFKSLRETLKEPGEFLECDFSKFGSSSLLHVYARALDEFLTQRGMLPQPGNKEHADAVLDLVNTLSQEVAEAERPSVDDGLIRRLASSASVVINPMAAIIGGLVGQEVVKASTGKFSPITQWFHMEFSECLPEEELSIHDVQPTGSRYDAMVAVFGRDFQEKLARLKYFMVGCGALGCEFLKNFALMGVASAKEGCITVTDDDIIERSNLTRQFLFRNRDVGQYKSEVAARAVASMNPATNIRALQDRVSTDTESVFDCDFWRSLDGVCNALDNVKARLYVDGRCIQYGLPLLESGTLGTKCNVQVILPHVTENYGASRDPQVKEAPQCILHNFPHTIEHCLPLARSEFVGHFETTPSETGNYINSESGQDYVDKLLKAGSTPSDVLDKLRGHQVWGGGIVDCIGTSRPSSFQDCVSWARLQFEDYFVNRIVQLTSLYPEGASTRSGAAFWTPPKRFPRPVAFDRADATCMQFIMAASNLRAKVFGLPIPDRNRDESFFQEILDKVSVPKFTPRDDITIETEENAEPADSSATASDDLATIQSLLEDLPAPSDLKKMKMEAEEFEKDDDSNFHMDYIGALANLRARNYSIQEVDKLQAKLKAGNIIPAIATTTAMVTGFVCLELCKIVNKKPLESHRNLFANLAVPLFAMSEPMETQKIVSRTEKTVPDEVNYPDYVIEEEIIAYPEQHTVWDHLRVENDRDFTLSEFIGHFDRLTVNSVSVQSSGMALFNTLLPHTTKRLTEKMSKLVESVGKVNITNRREVLLAVEFTKGEAETTVDTPLVIYNLL